MTKYGNATVIGDVNMTTADNHLETADAALQPTCFQSNNSRC